MHIVPAHSQGAFMHVAFYAVLVIAMSACAGPTAPVTTSAEDEEAGMLRRPTLPVVWPYPDSAGISPSLPRIVDPQPADALAP
jgi:hypothetical protein